MTRQDLDRLVADGCTVPGCEHQLAHGMFLHAQCHPSAGMRVAYLDGSLHLHCRTCKDLVVVVAVAKAPGEDALS